VGDVAKRLITHASNETLVTRDGKIAGMVAGLRPSNASADGPPGTSSAAFFGPRAGGRIDNVCIATYGSKT